MESGQIRASVAMAVYCGEEYIRQQIDSILPMLSHEDELVISYDKSSDSTWDIIKEYEAADERVRVVENSKPGVQNNFTNAVTNCRGRYIFLADQDDVWTGDKINTMVKLMREENAIIAMHDGYFADKELNPYDKTIFETYGTYNGAFRNFVKCTYWGCCMAFDARLVPLLCPFPNKHKVGHDLWIGVFGAKYGKIVRCGEKFILHRIHGDNESTEKRRAMYKVIGHRLALLGYIIGRRIKLAGKGLGK